MGRRGLGFKLGFEVVGFDPCHLHFGSVVFIPVASKVDSALTANSALLPLFVVCVWEMFGPIHIQIHIHIYIYRHIHTHTHIYIYTYIYIYIYILFIFIYRYNVFMNISVPQEQQRLLLDHLWHRQRVVGHARLQFMQFCGHEDSHTGPPRGSWMVAMV